MTPHSFKTFASSLLVGGLLSLVGCAGAGDGNANCNEGKCDDDGQQASLSFPEAGEPQLTGTLRAGSQVLLAYDLDRLPECRSVQGGIPQWNITAYVRDESGDFTTYEVSRVSGEDRVASPVLVDVPQLDELELYFVVHDTYGCAEYDSNGGGNYRFAIAAGADAAEIAFTDSWTVDVTGTPSAGADLVVTYDADRLPECRASKNGQPAWEIWLSYKFDGGLKKTVPMTRPSGSTKVTVPVTIETPPGANVVEMWFENTDAYGCSAYDSNDGANYHFDL